VILDQVWKRYGDTVAISNLSLNIEQGEFFVLFGPAGAGKTTTLNLIAGFVDLTAGDIYFGDKLVNDIPPEDRNVAMAFENYSLFPHMTIFDNLANPLRAPNVNMNSVEITARVNRTAELLNIVELLGRYPHQLSGGQKQRTALGRALVKEADILLLDEPLAHVDAKIRHELRTEFHRIDEFKEHTIVYVTHDYMEALSLGERIGVLNQGQIHQIADERDIYEKPIDVFVAESIGWPKINILDCEVKQEDGGVNLYSPDLDQNIRPMKEEGDYITDL
ncbi:unnamed protein product, partial [marine sediment metagenome]